MLAQLYEHRFGFTPDDIRAGGLALTGFTPVIIGALLATGAGQMFLGVTLASIGTMWMIWFLIAWAGGQALTQLLKKPISQTTLRRTAAGIAMLAASLPVLALSAPSPKIALQAQETMMTATNGLVLTGLGVVLFGAIAFVVHQLIRRQR